MPKEALEKQLRNFLINGSTKEDMHEELVMTKKRGSYSNGAQ